MSDAAASAAWYVAALGFVKLRESAGANFQRVILVHPDSQVAIGLTCHELAAGRRPGRFSERRVGMDHVAFAVGGREELDEWKNWLEELGVEHSEVKETPNGALITLRDPDNIQLELRAPNPGS